MTRLPWEDPAEDGRSPGPVQGLGAPSPNPKPHPRGQRGGPEQDAGQTEAAESRPAGRLTSRDSQQEPPAVSGGNPDFHGGTAGLRAAAEREEDSRDPHQSCESGHQERDQIPMVTREAESPPASGRGEGAILKPFSAFCS